MTNVVQGAFRQLGGDTEFPMPLALWKTTITLSAATGSFEPQNEIGGVVVGVWIDPSTLTASATIKGYMQDDDLSTPTYFLDYTVPNPAEETRAALNARTRVYGKLQVDVAGATSGDAFVLYVWVDSNADILDVTLEAGTALAGKFGIDQATANANEVVVKAAAYAARVSLTRPANTTAYTANDVLGATAAALTFAVGPTGGGEVLITSVALEIDVAAIPSGMTSFNLHLHNITPPSALADNAAFDVPSGDRASYLGFINMGSPADLGSTLYVQVEGVNKQVTLLGANVFGYLVPVGGFTPGGNSEVYVVTIHSVRL